MLTTIKPSQIRHCDNWFERFTRAPWHQIVKISSRGPILTLHVPGYPATRLSIEDASPGWRSMVYLELAGAEVNVYPTSKLTIRVVEGPARVHTYEPMTYLLLRDKRAWAKCSDGDWRRRTEFGEIYSPSRAPVIVVYTMGFNWGGGIE